MEFRESLDLSSLIKTDQREVYSVYDQRVIETKDRGLGVYLEFESNATSYSDYLDLTEDRLMMSRLSMALNTLSVNLNVDHVEHELGEYIEGCGRYYHRFFDLADYSTWLSSSEMKVESLLGGLRFNCIIHVVDDIYINDAINDIAETIASKLAMSDCLSIPVLAKKNVRSYSYAFRIVSVDKVYFN